MKRLKFHFAATAIVAATVTALASADVYGFARKLIIIHPRVDFIDPVGLVSDNGHKVVLTAGGPAVRVFGNTQIDAELVIFQESTGAMGQGKWRAKRLPEDSPETVTFTVEAHAVGGQTFDEGPIVACYFAEERAGGKLVSQWSKCFDVFLVAE
jgi:hypothetical protein